MGLMEALSGWLKQIVAVVLLAALVDLVLPNRTMQRYVRLVAGLIILLTMATPALQWIRGDFDSKLAAGMQAVEENQQAAPDELARIEEEGRKWRERGSVAAAELAAERLQDAIAKDVQQAEGVAVAEVKVDLQQQAAGGGFDVKRVTVALGAAAGVAENNAEADSQEDQQSAPTASAGMQPIEAVKPVAVAEPKPIRLNDEEQTRATETDPALRGRIAALIAARYGIPAQRIQITGGG